MIFEDLLLTVSGEYIFTTSDMDISVDFPNIFLAKGSREKTKRKIHTFLLNDGKAFLETNSQ